VTFCANPSATTDRPSHDRRWGPPVGRVRLSRRPRYFCLCLSHGA